jgi:hypothetical protein
MRPIEPTLLRVRERFHRHAQAQQNPDEDAPLRSPSLSLDAIFVVFTMIVLVSGLSAACGSERVWHQAQDRPQQIPKPQLTRRRRSVGL